eukprot:278629-Pelagomonas_calceolata.AAC.1
MGPQGGGIKRSIGRERGVIELQDVVLKVLEPTPCLPCLLVPENNELCGALPLKPLQWVGVRRQQLAHHSGWRSEVRGARVGKLSHRHGGNDRMSNHWSGRVAHRKGINQCML